MNFPDRITGPQFAEGDFLSFTFDEAQLTMRVPRTPDNRGAIDRISHQRDLRSADTMHLDHLGDRDHYTIPLALQTWNYQDCESQDDVAHALLDMEVLRHSDSEAQECFALKSDAFQGHILDEMRRHFEIINTDEKPSWPTRGKIFFAKPVKGDRLDGLQVHVNLGGGKQYPVSSAYFSLGRRYSLRIAFHLSSLAHSGRSHSYNEESMQKFMLEVFDDFLSHIRIEYTPETVALIEQFRKGSVSSHSSSL